MSPSVNLNRPETLTAWLVQVRDGRVDTLWKARVSTLPMQKTNTGVKHKDERRLEPDPVGGCQSKRRRNKKNQEVQRVRPALPKQNKTLTPDSHPSHPIPSPPLHKIGKSLQDHPFRGVLLRKLDAFLSVDQVSTLKAMSINGLIVANVMKDLSCSGPCLSMGLRWRIVMIDLSARLGKFMESTGTY